MRIRLFTILLSLALATASEALAQSTRHCQSPYSMASDAERMFEVFVSAEAAQIRQGHNLATQAASAPHGLLTDNATCVRLKKAVADVTGAKTIPALETENDLFFFRFGDYLGVLAIHKRAANDEVAVSGTCPLYVFDGKTLKYATALRF